METPSFREDHSSQIPAIQLLVNMGGYSYLMPGEVNEAREHRESNVILDRILRKQLATINNAKVSSQKSVDFSSSNIETAILALKDIPMVDGYMTTSEKAYELLTLGKSLEQSVEGDLKSFDLHYIDWRNPENNVFHVAEEFSVLRSGRKDTYRPDIVLFVNGIPMVIIECKRPDIKEPIEQAVSQHLRNQKDDGIRPLYALSQLVLSLSVNDGKYATTGTEDKFWAHWNESFSSEVDELRFRESVKELRNRPLDIAVKNKLFSEQRYGYVRKIFDDLEAEEIQPTPQDNYLYSLCRPDRLLDLAYNFVLFDNGIKKIARYQQYFAIHKAMKQITNVGPGEKRKGGVVWHTQGSGKSLTMVMLAQAIALEPSIRNPKIILVTDRTDLDTQITGTFRKCGIDVNNAKTGSQLVTLLKSNSDAVVTTIINKFETAVKKIKTPLESNNIFVLVDEGHRTQHGTFNIEMQKTMPKACFIAFTGTPLYKKDRNTLSKFGTLIDSYTVDQAVKDKAVVPLLYEGRHAIQDVNEAPLDNYFNMVSEPLSDYEKVDLKKKFSRADQLNIAEQKIYAISWDISRHFRDNFQGTGFKGQVVCQNKLAAVKYKNFLDEIGLVTSELVMSAPDDREGTETAYGKTSERVKAFWEKMMDTHGNSKKYQKNIVNRFKHDNHPELIIVVDKLLTGFDAPKNTVLYLTRKLQGHTLLQAIARVNRVAEDKDFGYIIDYYGVIEELDTALKIYSAFDEFEVDQLEGTLTNIKKEIENLPQAHSDLWQIFTSIKNKKDAEAYQQLLRDEAVRSRFYDYLAKYSRLLKLALSAIDFHKYTVESKIKRYKEDLSFFMKLRIAVASRYSDKVDFKKYEGQIQKLIDTHVPTSEVVKLTELVNVFEKEAFEKEVEKATGEAAKADMIASRTNKHITEKMDEDPTFYKKFSQLIKDTIQDYLQQRIDEAEYLKRMKDVMSKVLSKTDSSIPESLKEKEIARAYYGIALEEFNNLTSDVTLKKSIAEDLALAADNIIMELQKVDWQKSVDIPKQMIFKLGDYIIDEIRDKYDLKLSFKEIDKIAERIIDVAKVRLK
ncbi:type I restriction-modification system [Nonlabens ulvanivorans]|uniref:Type I restriction enzyme endonuclease subunit n=1 Tax=Nonlabens ulvanivorans TaxID=906888 RepID=A0A081D6B9_NONUL|nr:HsdR family type I site-specific deoxyribonuclease [Nonlabens ulvanivorans]GAK74465.1 type I restriction-modification system [Nonlabens ulvanivorans]